MWHVVMSRWRYRAIARPAHALKTGPCGGLAVWSTSQAATWHSSWHSVRSSFSKLSTTLLLNSTWAE
jgi:hypothetical protein